MPARGRPPPLEAECTPSSARKFLVWVRAVVSQMSELPGHRRTVVAGDDEIEHVVLGAGEPVHERLPLRRAARGARPARRRAAGAGPSGRLGWPTASTVMSRSCGLGGFGTNAARRRGRWRRRGRCAGRGEHDQPGGPWNPADLVHQPMPASVPSRRSMIATSGRSRSTAHRDRGDAALWITQVSWRAGVGGVQVAGGGGRGRPRASATPASGSLFRLTWLAILAWRPALVREVALQQLLDRRA